MAASMRSVKNIRSLRYVMVCLQWLPSHVIGSDFARYRIKEGMRKCMHCSRIAGFLLVFTGAWRSLTTMADRVL
jgi:hypothetical protein